MFTDASGELSIRVIIALIGGCNSYEYSHYGGNCFLFCYVIECALLSIS